MKWESSFSTLYDALLLVKIASCLLDPGVLSDIIRTNLSKTRIEHMYIVQRYSKSYHLTWSNQNNTLSIRPALGRYEYPPISSLCLSLRVQCQMMHHLNEIVKERSIVVFILNYLNCSKTTISKSEAYKSLSNFQFIERVVFLVWWIDCKIYFLDSKYCWFRIRIDSFVQTTSHLYRLHLV